MATARDGSLPQRFLDKTRVEERGFHTPCWVWTAYRNPAGYGQFGRGRREDGLALAHRFAYEVVIGPIPDGCELDHLCRQRACVNPEHLEAVSHAENVARGARNQYAETTACVNGHDFTPANTRIDGDGERVCRACHRERCRRSRARLRLAAA